MHDARLLLRPPTMFVSQLATYRAAGYERAATLPPERVRNAQCAGPPAVGLPLASIPPVATIAAPVAAATNWLATLPVPADSAAMDVDEPPGDASWMDLLGTWSPHLGRRRRMGVRTLHPPGSPLPSCCGFADASSTPAAQVAEQYRDTRQQLLDAAECAATRAADAARATKAGPGSAAAAQRPSTDVLLVQPSLSAYAGTCRELA